MYIIEQKGTGGASMITGSGRTCMSQQVGTERADTAAPGSNSGFRGWRICLPEPGTSSVAPRRSK